VKLNGVKAGKEKAGNARVTILSNTAIPNLASIPKITADLYLSKKLLAVNKSMGLLSGFLKYET
jgi:hypothetical protein